MVDAPSFLDRGGIKRVVAECEPGAEEEADDGTVEAADTEELTEDDVLDQSASDLAVNDSDVDSNEAADDDAADDGAAVAVESFLLSSATPPLPP
jgi:hypothetical protein